MIKWSHHLINKTTWMLMLVVLMSFMIFKFNIVVVLLAKLVMLLTPFLIGGAMAFVINVPLRFLETKVFIYIKNDWFRKIQRGVSILLSLFLIGFVLTVVGVIILPQLIDSISLFASNVPKYFNATYGFLEHLEKRVPDAAGPIADLKHYFVSLSPQAVQENIMSFFGSSKESHAGTDLLSRSFSLAFGWVSTFFARLLNMVIAFVFAIYILNSKEQLGIQGRRTIYAFFQPVSAKYLIHVFKVAFTKFYSFLTGQLMEACILGTLTCIGMVVLQLPYALMIGVLIGFTALVPIAGTFIGAFVGFLLILSVDVSKAFIFLVFLLILQQFEGNVIYPRVVGGSVGLPSMWTLFAITVGGATFGLIGMLLFVPLIGTIYTLFSEVIEGRLELKNLHVEDYNLIRGVSDKSD